MSQWRFLECTYVVGNSGNIEHMRVYHECKQTYFESLFFWHCSSFFTYIVKYTCFMSMCVTNVLAMHICFVRLAGTHTRISAVQHYLTMNFGFDPNLCTVRIQSLWSKSRTNAWIKEHTEHRSSNSKWRTSLSESPLVKR